MRLKHLFVVALLLVPFALQLNAQTARAIVGGSSALFLEMGQGDSAGSGNCNWTSSSGNVVTDSRIVAPNTESGNLWVVWTTGGGSCAAPGAGAVVDAYIQLDSTVGNRCFFAQPQCVLSTTKAALDGGAGLLTGFPDTALPATVLAAFNNKPINIAATDILPADAKFATYSTLALCGPLSSGTQFIGHGYGPGPVGQIIKSSYSGKTFAPVDFNVFGSDPITSTPVPGHVVVPVGASPVVVVLNTLNANGFGNAAYTNVNRGTLALFFSSIFVRTADMLPQAFAGLGGPYYGVTAISREPLSGTYRTFEHNIPNNKELFRSQEIGNCTNATYVVSTNPLNLTRTVGGTTGTHTRAIGTGEEVTQLTTVQDSIGYSFWSVANFAGKNNIKYVSVDGVDPFFDSYNNNGSGGLQPVGTIPQAGNNLLPNVTLGHIKDGSYPIWSMLRLVTTGGNESVAQDLATKAQSRIVFGGVNANPDFVPFNQMTVFRAHYSPVFVNYNATNTPSAGPSVCGVVGPPSGPAEAGGDAGGLVFSMQAGADYCILKGFYGDINNGVGITDKGTSFGVRQ